MKKTILMSMVLVTMSMAASAYAALNAVENIALVSKDNSSATLSWSAVSGATKYIVHYGTKSVQSSGALTKIYDLESDPVSSTGTTIKSLTGGTYYFAVTPVASTGEEGDILSKELSVTLGSGAITTEANFALSSVTVKDDRNITLSFSKPLSSSPASIKVKKTTDNSNVVVVSATVSKMDATKLDVKLATALSDATSYQAMITSIKGAQGETITEGSKSIRDFTTPPTIQDSAETIALGSGSKMTLATTGALTIATGSTQSGAMGSGALNSAPALPATGAKETLLLIVALIVGLAIASGMQFRKKAN